MPKNRPSRGGRGRGRGGRGGRGRGRGGGRKLYPTSLGYVYKVQHDPESSEDDLEDDFPLFGQFGAVDDPNFDPDLEELTKKENKSKRKVLDHRALVNQDLDFEDTIKQRKPATTTAYAKAVSFTRSSTVLNDDSTIEVTQEEVDEKVVMKENDASLGFYFDSTPSDIVVDEVSCSEPHSQQDNDSSVLGFHFDSSKQVSVEQQQPKKNKGKERAKRKIIPSDDIYLGSSSEDDKSENDIDDDDIAIMRDYIENVRLDDENDLEALRAFANGTDPSATHEVYEVSSEDDDDSDYIQNISDNDLDTVENGGFDHESEDEAVQEISENEFRIALQDSLDQVPPSLQIGIRNRIAKESRREKKIAKKQKQLDKRASKQAKREHEGNNVQLRKLDKRIRVFIMDDQLSSYQLAPMSKFCRRQLHLLATAYKLKSYSFGTGAQRTPVLQKTRDTCLPKDRRYIERFLDEAQSTIDAQSSILRKHRMENAPSFHNKKGKSGKKDKKDKKRKEKDQALINPVHNTVVGADAAPIGDSNVGHRMLAAMGWKQGDALGANNEGITAPIEAVIRKKRQGLGS